MEERNQHQSSVHVKGQSPATRKVLPPCVDKKSTHQEEVKTSDNRCPLSSAIKFNTNGSIKSTSRKTYISPETHNGSMTLKCDVCGKRFLNARTFAEHVNLHNASDMLSIDEVGPQFLSTPVHDDNVGVGITRLNGHTWQLESISPVADVSPPHSEAESTVSETDSFSTKTLQLRPSHTILDGAPVTRKKRKTSNSTSTFSSSQQSSESMMCTRRSKQSVTTVKHGKSCKKSVSPKSVKKDIKKARWLLRGKKRCVGNGENVLKSLPDDNVCERSLRKRVLGSGICLKPKSPNKSHYKANAGENGRLGINDELCKESRVLIEDVNVKGIKLSKSESVSKTQCTGDIGDKIDFPQAHFSSANGKRLKQPRVVVEDFSKLGAKLPVSPIKDSKVRKPCDMAKRNEYTGDFQDLVTPVQTHKQPRVVVEDLNIGGAANFCGDNSRRKTFQNCDKSMLKRDKVCVNESQRKTGRDVSVQSSVPDVTEHLLMDDGVNDCGRQTSENIAEQVTEKRWKCIVCGKRYHKTDDFIDHLNSHSSEDPSTLQSLISKSQKDGSVMPENSVNGASKIINVPHEKHLPVLKKSDSSSKGVSVIPKNSHADVGESNVGKVPNEIDKGLVKESLHVPGENGLLAVGTDVLENSRAGTPDFGNVPREVKTDGLKRDLYKCEYCGRRFRRQVSYIQHVAAHWDAEKSTNRNFSDVQSQKKGAEESVQHSIEDQSVRKRTSRQFVRKVSSIQSAVATEQDDIPEALHKKQRFAQGPEDTVNVAAVESDLLLESAGFQAIGESTNLSAKVADACDGHDSSLQQDSNYMRRVKSKVCSRRSEDGNKLIVHVGSHVMDGSLDLTNIRSDCSSTVTVTESVLLPKAAEGTQATLSDEGKVDSDLGHDNLKENKLKEEEETDWGTALQMIAEKNGGKSTRYDGSVKQVDSEFEEIATYTGVEEYDDDGGEIQDSKGDKSDLDYVVKKEEDWDESDAEEVKLSRDGVMQNIMHEELLVEDRKANADVFSATPPEERIHRDDQLGPNLETVTSAKSTPEAFSGRLEDGTVLVGEDHKATTGSSGKGSNLDNDDYAGDKNESKENVDSEEPEEIAEELDGVEVGNVRDALQSLGKLTSSTQVEPEKIQAQSNTKRDVLGKGQSSSAAAVPCPWPVSANVSSSGRQVVNLNHTQVILSQTVQGTEHQDSAQSQRMNGAPAVKPQQLMQSHQVPQTSNSFQNNGQAFDLGNTQYSSQCTGLSGNMNRPQVHPHVTIADVQSSQLYSQWLQNVSTLCIQPAQNNQTSTVQNASTFKDHLPVNFGITNNFLQATRYSGPSNNLSYPNGFSACQFPSRYAGNLPSQQFPLSISTIQNPIGSLIRCNTTQNSLGNFASHTPNVAHVPYYGTTCTNGNPILQGGQTPHQLYPTVPTHHPAQHSIGQQNLPNFGTRDMGQFRFGNYLAALANQHERLAASHEQHQSQMIHTTAPQFSAASQQFINNDPTVTPQNSVMNSQQMNSEATNQIFSEVKVGIAQTSASQKGVSVTQCSRGFPLHTRTAPSNALVSSSKIESVVPVGNTSVLESNPNDLDQMPCDDHGKSEQSESVPSVNETDNISDGIAPESPGRCPATPLLCINVEPLELQSESVAAEACHERDTCGNNNEVEASPMQTRSSKRNKSFSSKQPELKCDLCGKKLATKKSLKRHMVLHSSKHKCHVCGRALATKASYDAHMKMHDKLPNGTRPLRHAVTRTKEQSFQCDTCSKSFQWISSFLKHKRMVHNEEMKEGEASGVLLSYYNCNVCGVTFDKPNRLAEHEQSHLDDDQTNDVTSSSETSGIQEKDRHAIVINAGSAEEHTDVQDLLKCQICGQVLETLEKLRSHASKHTKCYKCYICEKMFASSKSLRHHLLTHTGRSKADVKQRMDANPGCSKVDHAQYVSSANRDSESTTKKTNSGVDDLDSPQSHYVHQESHGQTDQSGYQLGKAKEDNRNTASRDAGNSCDIAALTKSSLGLRESSTNEDNLENLHTEDKSDEDDQDVMIISEDGERDSDKQLSQSTRSKAIQDVFVFDDISNQKSAGSKKKQLKCEVCGVGFSCSGDLNEHLKTHTYCCDICGRKFAKMDNLISHLRFHSGDKHFECSECGEMFRSQGSLNIHMSQDCGNNPIAKHDGYQHSDCPVLQEGAIVADVAVHNADSGVELFDIGHGAQRSTEKMTTQPVRPLQVQSDQTTAQLQMQHCQSGTTMVMVPNVEIQSSAQRSSILMPTVHENAQVSVGNSQVPAINALGVAQMPTVTQRGTQVLAGTPFTSDQMPVKTLQGNTEVPTGTELQNIQMPAETTTGDAQVPAETMQGGTKMPAGNMFGSTPMPAETLQRSTSVPDEVIHQMPTATSVGYAQELGKIGNITIYQVPQQAQANDCLTNAAGKDDRTCANLVATVPQKSCLKRSLDAADDSSTIKHPKNGFLGHIIKQRETSDAATKTTTSQCQKCDGVVEKSCNCYSSSHSTSYQYKKNDEYFICEECYTPFTSIKRLQNHLAISHSIKYEFADLEKKVRTVKKKLSYACRVCRCTFYSVHNFLGHIKMHGDLDLATKEMTSECEKCNGILGESCNCYSCSSSHSTSYQYKKNDEYFICEECYTPFTSIKRLQNHMAISHSIRYEFADLEKKVRTVKKKLSYACRVCHCTFYSVHNFLGHIKMHGDLDLATKEMTSECEKCNGVLGESCNCYSRVHVSSKSAVKCKVCGRMLANGRNLVKHMKTHSGQKPHICEICGQRFLHKSSFSHHMMVHNNVWLYNCDKCDRKFRMIGPYNAHMKEHSTVYQCEICGKTLANQNKLKKHKVEVHEDDWPFTCKGCGKGFFIVRNLNCHKKTCGKGYQCNQCDKKYKWSRDLSLHMLVHTGEQKEFKCDFCDFSFDTKYELDRHRMTHTGEKPYSCQYCSKKFIQSFFLRTHMKTHNVRAKLFPCDGCEESFEFKRQLTKHKEEKHPDDDKPRYRRKWWNCEECGKSFKMQRQLTRHQKEKHPQESTDESSDESDAESLQLSDDEEDGNNSTESDSNDSSHLETE